MNTFEKIVNFFQMETAHQVPYGWFHLMFVGLVILSTILLCVFCRNSSKKTHKIILTVFWLIMLVFELYKQLVFSFEYKNGVASWEYEWYSFPFQFCSSPIYILPFAIFIKKEKVSDYFESFLGTFALFAGLAVMVMPGDIFNTGLIGVAIQTMVHHGSMVVLGIYLLFKNRNKLNLKYFLKGIAPFAGLLVVATVLNESIIHITTETFNMFFISRHFECTLPVLSVIYAKTPYVVFLLTYIIGFSLCAMLVFGIARLIKLIVDKSNKRKTAK